MVMVMMAMLLMTLMTITIMVMLLLLMMMTIMIRPVVRRNAKSAPLGDQDPDYQSQQQLHHYLDDDDDDDDGFYHFLQLFLSVLFSKNATFLPTFTSGRNSPISALFNYHKQFVIQINTPNKYHHHHYHGVEIKARISAWAENGHL